MRAVISCKGIKKHYGEGENRIEALSNIDLDINQGELTLLVGPSGSGKSTFLSIITMILTPDSGQLLILDQDVMKMSDQEKALFRNKHLGSVFQSLFLIPSLSVLENISVPLLVAGHSEEEAEAKSMEVLKLMHLEQRANSSPSNLSKGQQQRVAIARGIVNDAKILVCDEPTSALDHHVGMEIMSLLHDLAHKSSRAVFVVTHDHRIFSFADRIVNISDGQITTGNENE